MQYVPFDREVLDSEAEICLSLWYFSDEEGIVMRLAGKAYALTGTDEDKTTTLKFLAGTDHLTATLGTVPKNFVLDFIHRKMEGATTRAGVKLDHGGVFRTLIDQIERELPKGLRCVAGKYEQFVQEVPSDPLCVTTIVIERSDGALVAKVATCT